MRLNYLTAPNYTSEMASNFYVYAYFEPDAQIPFYVGKGTRHRAHAHLNQSHNAAVTQAISNLRCNGLEPEVRLLFFGTHDECKCEEIRLIQLFGRRDVGRGPLLNLTDGGDGTLRRPRHEAERALLRAAAKQQWNEAAARAKKIEGIRESWRNPSKRENRLLGAIKGGAALRARILANPAERRRLSEQIKRAWTRPAFRQSVTAAAKARFATAQARAKMSAKIRKKHELDAGYRQRISAGVKERLKDPAVRERLLNARRDPVRRAKLSAFRKGRNYMSESVLERVSRAKSKLAVEDLCTARKLHSQGDSTVKLAHLYGVSPATMYRAIVGSRRAYRADALDLAPVKEAMRRNREAGARKRRRLKESDVAELFRMRAAGISLRRIAVKFHVTRRTIMNILAGRIYRDCRADALSLKAKS